MYHLKNAQLDVSILDPVADQIRLGSRYCSGGYIYQVTDSALGALCSGPAYPAEFPPVFDGQGLPEAFRDGLGPGGDDAVILAIGVGLVTRKAREVKQYCQWQVTQAANMIQMKTTQVHLDWSLELTRTVTLENRTVKSETRLKNTGRGEMPFRWFPHPFFPLTPNGECCKFSVPVSFPENPGYTWAPSGFIARKLENWENSPRGFFQGLNFEPQGKITVVQRHPTLGLVVATCNYCVTSLPIWGNRNTFSFEPYYESAVWFGQELVWDITYDF